MSDSGIPYVFMTKILIRNFIDIIMNQTDKVCMYMNYDSHAVCIMFSVYSYSFQINNIRYAIDLEIL